MFDMYVIVNSDPSESGWNKNILYMEYFLINWVFVHPFQRGSLNTASQSSVFNVNSIVLVVILSY